MFAFARQSTSRVGQLLTRALLCVGLCAPAATLVGETAAQADTAKAAAVTTPAVPTITSMAQSVLSQDYTVIQLRRFRDENGNVVTVRERLQVDANGSHDPRFSLAFLAVEGEPAGSPLSLKWQQAYARYGTLFVRQGSFQIRDLALAASNYTLHDFGPVVRAGRSARRMVVFPNSLLSPATTGQKPLWVLDVDVATNVPLFVAEFDSQLRLRAEIEVVNFLGAVQASLTPMASSMIVTPMADFAAADTFLGSPTGLIDPDISVIPNYGLSRVEVVDDPINGRQKLVMTYTDGIDQFMVVQTVNTPDPFASLPGTQGSNGNAAGHTIGRFRDPAVSALVFWEDGVAFHVAGRGSLASLDDVARSVYLQALAN